MLDEGVGDSERRWRRGARKRGKQRRGGGGEVRSYVAVHHARVEEMGRGGARPRRARRRRAEMSEEAQG